MFGMRQTLDYRLKIKTSKYNVTNKLLLNNNLINKESIVPIKCYDALLNKQIIFIENKDKSGIYRWVNKLNNNTYVGSGLNLSKRIKDYYKESELKRNIRPIHAALLKYGYENFKLEILEYCKADELLTREQYYLDILTPEYNILKNVYSLLGYKHSIENLAKFKLKKNFTRT